VIPGYGNAVVISHGEGWTSLYGHMQSPSPLAEGQAVSAGAYIGPVGSTGNSTGPHLHLQWELDGVPQNPTPTIEDAPLASSHPINKGLLMALSDAEQAEVLNTVRALAGFLYAGGTDAAAGRFDNNSVIGRVRSLQEATFYGGPSMKDGGRSMSQSLADVNTKISSVFDATFNGGSSMKDAGKSISQSLADINGKVS